MSEKEIFKAFEKGELKRVKNAKQEMLIAREAAVRYMKKDARINIRLAGMDLDLIKRRAGEEGLPYQTLIASILHKYAMGNLKPPAFREHNA